MFAAEGPDIVRELIARGKDVFVDLKMYDIGATVERATARVAGLGARFMTVHSSPQVIRAALAGAAGSQLKILAVTVLTSFDDSDVADLGYTGLSASTLVEHFVRKGVAAGVTASSARRLNWRACGRWPDRRRFWSRRECARPAPRTAIRSAWPRRSRLCARARIIL